MLYNKRDIIKDFLSVDSLGDSVNRKNLITNLTIRSEVNVRILSA